MVQYLAPLRYPVLCGEHPVIPRVPTSGAPCGPLHCCRSPADAWKRFPISRLPHRPSGGLFPGSACSLWWLMFMRADDFQGASASTRCARFKLYSANTPPPYRVRESGMLETLQ
jgi:hypothetical protein